MSGKPISSRTSVKNPDPGNSRTAKEHVEEPDIRTKFSTSRIHAGESTPTKPAKKERRKHEDSTPSGRRKKSLRRQRSNSSPTLQVNAEEPRSPVSRRALPRINLDLLSVETTAVVQRKPAPRGQPPGPWNLSSPRAQGRLGTPLPEGIGGLSLDELVARAESLRSKVEGSRALYAGWWTMYEHFPKSESKHDDVVAMHRQLKEATEASGWAIHDELNRAQVLLHVIDGRLEKLENG